MTRPPLFVHLAAAPLHTPHTSPPVHHVFAEAFSSLVEGGPLLAQLRKLGLRARFQSQFATVDSARFALEHADVVFLSAHADERAHIALEDSTTGKAVFLAPDDFVRALAPRGERQACRLVVLAVCHSEALAERLVQSGQCERVICCKRAEKVRSDVAPHVFAAVLAGLATCRQGDMHAVFDYLIQAMCDLQPTLGPNRGVQSEKFTIVPRSPPPLLFRALVLERGLVVDETLSSAPMLFEKRVALPLIGRAALAQTIVERLHGQRHVVLCQREDGVGATSMALAVAQYFASRRIASEVRWYKDARAVPAGGLLAPRTLVVIEPVQRDFSAEAFLKRCPAATYVLAVARCSGTANGDNGAEPVCGHVLVPPLEPAHAGTMWTAVTGADATGGEPGLPKVLLRLARLAVAQREAGAALERVLLNPAAPRSVQRFAVQNAFASLFAEAVARQLDEADLAACLESFGPAQLISRDEFERAWAERVLPVFAAIRGARRAWESRALMGIMSRERAVHELTRHGALPGDFALRATLSRPGCLAVSFVVGVDKPVKHVLVFLENASAVSVEHEEAGGRRVQFESLRAFVMRCEWLQATQGRPKAEWQW